MLSVQQRFEEKVELIPFSTCHYWGDHLDKDDYGRFWFEGRNIGAHRFAYKIHKGDIPEGRKITHTCNNHSCVNPDHLCMEIEKSLQERFEEKVHRTSGCHLWTASLHSAGYGQLMIKRGKRPEYAHRIAYELYIGPIPKGKFVLHGCDNELCVNPKHLRLGTVQDNSDDMVNRNRQAKGENVSGSKLKESEVLEIYHSKEKQAMLSKKYKVSSSIISRIKNYLAWKHITQRIS